MCQRGNKETRWSCTTPMRPAYALSRTAPSGGDHSKHATWLERVLEIVLYAGGHLFCPSNEPRTTILLTCTCPAPCARHLLHAPLARSPQPTASEQPGGTANRKEGGTANLKVGTDSNRRVGCNNLLGSPPPAERSNRQGTVATPGVATAGNHPQCSNRQGTVARWI